MAETDRPGLRRLHLALWKHSQSCFIEEEGARTEKLLDHGPPHYRHHTEFKALLA